MVRERVAGRGVQQMALLIQSFGYKHGVPVDSDFVFDVRCLPNPTGTPVYAVTRVSTLRYRAFWKPSRIPGECWETCRTFSTGGSPAFHTVNRSYMTVSIGCTGGQHRSVYMAEQLAAHFVTRFNNVQIRHTELPDHRETSPGENEGSS